MSNNTAFDDFRKELNGRPGKPIVLGVCLALARRFDMEPWVTRTIVIISLVFFTVLALGVYIALGYILDETKDRTSGFFKGLAIWIQERISSVGSVVGKDSKAP